MARSSHTQSGKILVALLVVIILILWTCLIIGGFFYWKSQHEEKKDSDTSIQLQLEYGGMLAELKQKKDLIVQKEEMLAKQEQRIKELEGELAVARKTLESVQQDMASKVIDMEQSERKNLRKLAKLYGLMDPAQAAPILAGLDDGTVVNILMNMNERQAARLIVSFAAQNSDCQRRAALISEQMRKLTVKSIKKEE